MTARVQATLYGLSLLFLLAAAFIASHPRRRPARSEPAAAQVSAAQPSIEPEPLRVLFLGNSLTSSSDLPGMVARLAVAANQPRAFAYVADTPGGFGLAEHLAANRLQPALKLARFDAVVLQEQGLRPGWRKAWFERFAEPARALDAIIRNGGSKPVFYVTFARRHGDPDNFPNDDYDAMQQRVLEGYARVAAELGAESVPVGGLLQKLHRERPDLRLWSQDGEYPSLAAGYLAACAFYAHFYGQSPVGNPFEAGLPPADARVLQRAAEGALPGAPPLSAEPALPPSPTAAERVTSASADPALNEATARREAFARFEAEQDRLRHARIEADLRTRSQRRARAGVPIAMYSTSWCGACKTARAYMTAADIAFTEHDIDTDTLAKAAAYRLNPRGSVPTIDLDGNVLVGWNAQHFETTLDQAARKRAGR